MWITDLGGWGGTWMLGKKLEPQSERRLLGDEFWCDRNRRQFRVSRFIPSPGDFLLGDSSGGEEDGREDVGLAESPTGRPDEPAARERETTGAAEEGKMEPSAGAEIWFNDVMEKGQVDDFVIAWSDRGLVKNYSLRDGG